MDTTAAKQAIAEVLVSYASGIDRRDWPRFRQVFAENCDLVYEGAGEWQSAGAITEFMIVSHESMGHTMHRISNIDIDLDDDTATTRCYVDAMLMAPDGKSGINAVGFYDDELQLGDDRWQITRRRYTMVRLVAVGAEGDLIG